MLSLETDGEYNIKCIITECEDPLWLNRLISASSHESCTLGSSDEIEIKLRTSVRKSYAN